MLNSGCSHCLFNRLVTCGSDSSSTAGREGAFVLQSPEGPSRLLPNHVQLLQLLAVLYESRLQHGSASGPTLWRHFSFQ